MRTAEDANRARARQSYVDLILMEDKDFGSFVVDVSSGAPRCLRVQLSSSLLQADSLAKMVELGAREQLGLYIRHLGVASVNITSQSHELVSMAQLTVPLAQQPHQLPALRLFSLARLGEERPQIDHLAHFAAARDRGVAEHSAATMGPLIQRAYRSSLDHLHNRLSSEDGRIGWSQYLDRRSIGLISTSQGILAHFYAGEQPDVLQAAVETLIEMQNPDGGWQVRRALIGGSSTISITESTCYCLLALLAVGRSVARETIDRGIRWLEQTQRDDGGWGSSAHTADTQVCATSLAIRVLAEYGQVDMMSRAVTWLRRQRHDDGGWGAGARHSGAEPSSPAYTAHAIMALVAADPGPDDDVAAGCRYLEDSFDDRMIEPWQATAVNMIVDDETAVRLEFRHFSTALALTALAEAGWDLGNRTVLLGTRRLLERQQADGSWRCALTADGANTIWALHNALHALHSITRATVRKISVVARSDHDAREREVLDRAVLQLIKVDHAQAHHHRVRGWLQTSWLSALSIIVLLLVAAEFGLFEQLAADSGVRRAASVVFTAILALAGALLPPILTEEYKIRRTARTQRGREDGS